MDYCLFRNIQPSSYLFESLHCGYLNSQAMYFAFRTIWVGRYRSCWSVSQMSGPEGLRIGLPAKWTERQHINIRQRFCVRDIEVCFCNPFKKKWKAVPVV
ncbi:hypothetical protein CISG_08158 [Coccidioides immitis RMSCC 3703]|uniref:Uncharacterized protein n=1 Tax=Coccidioides immitis RMSCC 3703 TaxID=454286 RepID=A0A0J8R8C4_COCIT|nr:hypothetical protein CISG_08158 [Coccidioides immitis RMSCC 3703]